MGHVPGMSEHATIWLWVLAVVCSGAGIAAADDLPNLAPYHPTNWSDKIVVTTQVGSTIESINLTPADTLYVDWAVLNQGNVATAAQFTTALYVDGTLQFSWTTNPPLNPAFYAYVTDYALGMLSAGTHTLTLRTDTTNAIAESDEQDNEYAKVITVSDFPNLTPYQPTNWSDKIVVTTQAGSTTDSVNLAPTDTLYVDWAVRNQGSLATAAQFTTALYVDGTLQFSWTTNPPLNPAFYAYVTDYALGMLSAGTHTLTLRTDSTNAIAESDEQDNEYAKVITVGGTTGACIGSCNDDSEVTVDDIVAMVKIALGESPVTSCEAGDGNRDQQIAIDEILIAIENALTGCS